MIAQAGRQVVIQGRNGQSAAQTEADQRECNRWSNSQPGAAGPEDFQRSFAACMDGFGYSVTLR